MTGALRQHWPEYLIEAAGLGVFLFAAAGIGTLLEYPGSPVHRAIPSPVERRMLMGLAMGLTAVAIIYSRWGMRSGAHINPAVTFTFLRLGKVRRPDAFFYVGAQFAGGLLGLLMASWLLGPRLAEDHVRYVATLPDGGSGAAFLAEVTMTFVLMTVILRAGNAPRWHRFTGLLAGGLVALYIALEAPVSGMSLNPARTFASALPGGIWDGIWIYFTAPVLGMLLAAEFHVRRGRRTACAKLHHANRQRCIFRCGFGSLAAAGTRESRSADRLRAAPPGLSLFEEEVLWI